MRIGQELALKQIPKLVMTPELRQAITVLQLPIMDLRQYIEGQLLENPLLEIEDQEPSDISGEPEGLTESTDFSATPQDKDLDPQERQDDKSADIDWEQYFADSSDVGYRETFPSGFADKDDTSFENMATSPLSLHDHLMLQLRLACSGRDFTIGEFIIGNIDDDGYLRSGIEEIASMCGASPDQVIHVLRLIQSFEPSGVGARNIAECLLLQVRTLDLDPGLLRLAEAVIQGHLEDLAYGRYHKIAESLGISVQDAQKAGDLVRTLDPKPGREFGGTQGTNYIIPDVIIQRVGREYVVIVNDQAVPKLTLSATYRRLLRSPDEYGEVVSDFIKAKLNSAMWLLKSIERRRLTLQRVTECIVKFQRKFLEYGIEYLRPLTLREVADAVGVHESTVSRATSGKYAETPQGTFSFRFFFASGVSTALGDGAAAGSVKKRIKELIEQEDARNPLSDQDITDELRKAGVMISRRTVAKYREELGIPASSKRRRY
ncbi:MAG TPA: RNA polymerase factor sigma-54 [Firmicutes bacterium]|nr:RNA polymerase factor sigma-54 [Bacillota bacterium]HHY98500.1 RNA polymerase factor sigma-54 [Bacillota bacterium]